MKVTNTFGTFLVSLLSASAAAGAAVPVARSQGTIELKQTPNTKFSGKNGPLALARAYAKYGAPIPDDLAAIVQKIFDSNSLINNLKRDNGTGTATATPVSDDLEYLVEVAIGTPAQNLKLDFDTGSSDLWVFSSETPAGDKGSHSIYTPSQSSTSSAVQGATWSISYGDGSSSSGNVYKDDVSLGGLTVQGQDVELAQKVSSQFVSGQGDGLLGLAWDSINTVKPGPAKTWFDNIASSLDKPLFTADLKHQQPGSYTFGGIPSGAGTVNYAPVDNSQGFWQFSTTTSLGGGSITAIADTGTTLLLLSDDQVTAYYKGVAGAENNSQQGGYTFNCDATLPDFKFKVGSGEITVPGSLINYQTVSGNTCFGGLQSAGSIGFNIFGDIALKSSYVVFDQGNTQVGWAQKTQ